MVLSANNIRKFHDFTLNVSQEGVSIPSVENDKALIKEKTSSIFAKLGAYLASFPKIQGVKGYQSSPWYSLLCKLSSMQELDRQIIQYLEEELYDNHEVFLAQNVTPEIDLQKALQKRKRIIIPLIFEGKFFRRDHITTLIVDAQKHKIIFLDSKGNSLKYFEDHALRADESNRESVFKVRDLWQRLIEQINQNVEEKTWVFSENTTQYQEDGYNCGIHFYQTAKSYALQGEFDPPLNTLEKIREQRKAIIDRIIAPVINDLVDEFEKVEISEDGDQPPCFGAGSPIPFSEAENKEISEDLEFLEEGFESL